MQAETRSALPEVTDRDMANAIRALAMDAVERAKSGHPGMPMGMADAATALFTQVLRFDPAHPDWPDRDRFVLSAGHGSMLLYALLHLTGYADMTMEEIRNFRQLGSRTAGHPEYGHAAGIETTTGPLGQGLANAVGMALAERLLGERFGAGLVDHRTYVVVGDGCLMEGISHEAASLAGHLRLGKLIALWDDNRISIDGPTDLSVSDDVIARFRAYGWATAAVDGHDGAAVIAALHRAAASDRPTLIACRTTIGYGAPTKGGTAATHGAPLGEAEVAAARQRLGWSHPPFEIPAPVAARWRDAGRRGSSVRAAWQTRVDALAKDTRATYLAALAGELPGGWKDAMSRFREGLVAAPQNIASRRASELALEVLTAAIPELIGGSADLTGSNNTKTIHTPPLRPGQFQGRYVYYGVREHAMAAAMNGMALHGGVIPYGGTFLVFSDYCRPAIRLAALMGQRVVFVLTHDSIGLGEDGPTHQPVEHLASLRAIPNLLVMRPADAIETAECWELALENRDRPSVLALSRQNLPPLRQDAGQNRSARGGYVLLEADGPARVTLIGTGSEVAIAVAAHAELARQGVATRVVSLPCWELFGAQDAHYRASVLGPGTVRIGIEAGSPLGWERFVGDDGVIIGMTGFGASAPAGALYAHFKITPETVVAAALALLQR
ncbi:MAG: transketolase [Alphaproteobacteria bacterium]|nr:transketolase [Alphaproteobacteria bacterium]